MTISNRTQQTNALKNAIFRTFNELQAEDQPYSLIEWAKQNPKEFYTGLLPRILPKPVEISAAEGVNFAIVYQMGAKQMQVGEDGLPFEALSDPDVVDGEVVCCHCGGADHASEVCAARNK
jgi:hypothetical protein